MHLKKKNLSTSNRCRIYRKSKMLNVDYCKTVVIMNSSDTCFQLNIQGNEFLNVILHRVKQENLDQRENR